MVLKLPENTGNQPSRIKTSVTLLDLFPTILDWFGIQPPTYSLQKHGRQVEYTGASLLGVIAKERGATDR